MTSIHLEKEIGEECNRQPVLHLEVPLNIISSDTDIPIVNSIEEGLGVFITEAVELICTTRHCLSRHLGIKNTFLKTSEG